MKVQAQIVNGEDLALIKDQIESELDSEQFQWENFYSYLTSLNSIGGITQLQDYLSAHPIFECPVTTKAVIDVIFNTSDGEELKKLITESQNFSLVNFDDAPLEGIDEVPGDAVRMDSGSENAFGAEDEFDNEPDFNDSSEDSELPNDIKIESTSESESAEDEGPKLEHKLNRVVWRDQKGQEHIFVSDVISDMEGVKVIFGDDVASLVSVDEVNFSGTPEELQKAIKKSIYLNFSNNLSELNSLLQDFALKGLPAIEVKIPVTCSFGEVKIEKSKITKTTSNLQVGSYTKVVFEGKEYSSLYDTCKSCESEKFTCEIIFTKVFESPEQRDSYTKSQLISDLPTIPSIERSSYDDLLENFSAKSRLVAHCSKDGCTLALKVTEININGWEDGKSPTGDESKDFYFNIPESGIKAKLESWKTTPPSEISRFIKDKDAFKASVETLLSSSENFAFNWKGLVGAAVLGLSTVLGSPAEAKNLADAIVQVESSGKKDAVGDNGKAKGLFQIWDVVVKDVNRVYKTNYTHDDAFDPKKARDIFDKYTTFWAKQYEKKTGKKATDEVISRIWNGGPNGWNNPKTLKYWEKVKKELDNE